MTNKLFRNFNLTTFFEKHESVLIAFTIIFVCLLLIFSIFLYPVLSPTDNGTITISEEDFYNSKSDLIGSDVNKYALEYTRDLCSSAITQKTSKTILDEFITVAYMGGDLYMDYSYHSDDGFFKVKVIGDARDDLVKKIGYNYGKRRFYSIECQYDGNYITMTKKYEYNQEILTEKNYYNEKASITTSSTDYLEHIKNLCREAVTKKTREKIYDDYIVVWEDTTGVLKFSYAYRSKEGIFKVPAVGDDNMIARSIINETETLKEESSYDIQYTGNVLEVIISS